MKQIFLLPNRCRTIGWVLLVPALVLGWMVLTSEFEFRFLEFQVRPAESTGTSFDGGGKENFTNELVGATLLLSLFFIGFARLKIEDEYTWKLRLDALQWGIYVYYLLVLITLFMFYNFDYLLVMIVNLFTPLIIFIIRFYYLLKTQ